MTDVVIIGGGHNGLVTAFYLARAGMKPLVLERRHEVGGGAVTGELHPGFHCPTLSHEVLLHQQIVRDMELRRHGLDLLEPAAQVCSLSIDREPLVLHDDAARSRESVRRLNIKDGDQYTSFRAAIGRVASVLATTFRSAPPSIDEPGASDLWNLLQAGRRFRSLGSRDGSRLLRWLPMPVADLMHEWFDSERLRATVAAPALSGTMLGPRSAGSALVLLLREAHQQLAGRSSMRVRGGPGALTRALAAAARSAGAEIRTDAAVERILLRDDRVDGVIAAGQRIAATTVVSAVDPKTTFLTLIDPVDLTPGFATKMRNYRAAGTVAKVNLALSGLPAFQGVNEWGGRLKAAPTRDLAPMAEALSGRIHIGPDLDYLERAFDHAKYGELSADPWLDISLPSILEPELAPAGAHVASVYVHYAPYRLRGSDWNASREALLAATTKVLERHAPGIRSQIVAAQVITPAEIESDYGFFGGHIFHGELALDQLFTMRPLLGLGKYDTPIRGLFLSSAGTHPGGFMSGASGRLAAREVLRAGKR